MTQNESAIEQINLGYHDQEDRLLLKLGLADKTELVVWVTRRVCKSMWSLLQAFNISLTPPPIQVTNVESKQSAIENFVLEAVELKKIEHLDFESEYVADRQTRSEAPMLVVQCSTTSSENRSMALILQCSNGQSVNMALTTELVHALGSMIQLATREAGWDLQLPPSEMQITQSPMHQMLH